MTRRPKLLFLAYTFPPLETSACVRTWNIAKHLARLGWDVTVVTPHLPWLTEGESGTTVSDALRDAGIRRILTNHEWRVLLRGYWKSPLGALATRLCRRIASHLKVEPSHGWLKAAEVACNDLTSDEVDVILSTGPPFGAFRLAARIANRLGRPYVLDYRDPWTQSPPNIRRFRQTAIDQELELLKGSAAVTTVSKSWKTSLDKRFNVGSKVHVVYNGYDVETLSDVKPCNFGHFAIVYTGIFYPPQRVITPLMAALQHMKLKKVPQRGNSSWRFHYYGPHLSHVRQEAERFDVKDRVVLHGKVSHAEALSAVRGAGAAVTITSTVENGPLYDRGVVTGKVFESLGLGTPILLIAPRESDAREVIKGNCLANCFTGSETEAMAGFLTDLMRNSQARTCKSNGRYSWHVLSKRLDVVLREVVENRPTNSCHN